VQTDAKNFQNAKLRDKIVSSLGGFVSR